MSIETLNDKNSTREMLNDFFSKEMKEVVDSVPEMNLNYTKSFHKVNEKVIKIKIEIIIF